MRYFHEAAEIDLSRHMGNATGGVHIAAMGGLWQATVFGIGGVRLRDDGFILEPHLPPDWSELAFSLQWRGRTVAVQFTRDPAQVAVELRRGDSMTVALSGGTATTIHSHRSHVAHRAGTGWGEWQTVRR
jgi:kojibiose phosphorylase